MKCNGCNETILQGEACFFLTKGTYETYYFHLECGEVKKEQRKQRYLNFSLILVGITLLISVGGIIYLLANLNNKKLESMRGLIIPLLAILTGQMIYYIISGKSVYDLIKGQNKRPKKIVETPYYEDASFIEQQKKLLEEQERRYSEIHKQILEKYSEEIKKMNEFDYNKVKEEVMKKAKKEHSLNGTF